MLIITMGIIAISAIVSGLFVEGLASGKHHVSIIGMLVAWTVMSILTFVYMYVIYSVLSLEFKFILYLINFL
jgi:hypothetical protein